MQLAILERVQEKTERVVLSPKQERRRNANSYLIELLINEYNFTLNSGEVAPEGCWLEIAKCHGRKSFQVFFRSTEPIFDGKKRKYVGMKGSPKHRKAEASIYRREHLHRLTRDIKRLQYGDEA